MRQAFSDALVARAAHKEIVFLTGDLGYAALEPVQKAIGERFINAGVAEQNMVSVAAALSYSGFETWVYSIAPFCTARPFEQIRNDVALHGLPVKLVGNGGGFGYGVMGPTHHAIEDYGILLTLPGMQVCVPAFDEDIASAIETVGGLSQPCYLRLGRGEQPAGWIPPPFAPWRQLLPGKGPVILAVGPLSGSLVQALLTHPEDERPSLWSVSMLPLHRYPPPAEFMAAIARVDALVVTEEHVAQGSVASELALTLAQQGRTPRHFKALHAGSLLSDGYGSQQWLRRQAGLTAADVLAAIHAP